VRIEEKIAVLSGVVVNPFICVLSVDIEIVNNGVFYGKADLLATDSWRT
jgi:hypothetical protein